MPSRKPSATTGRNKGRQQPAKPATARPGRTRKADALAAALQPPTGAVPPPLHPTGAGGTNPSLPDPVEMAQKWLQLGERARQLVQEFAERQQSDQARFDASHFANLYWELARHWLGNPQKLWDAQISLWQDYLSLWQRATGNFLGSATEPAIRPQPGDRRFQDPAWNESVVFDFIKQSYLLTARWLQGLVQQTEGLEAHQARKLEFYTRQFVDALAPSNFVMTNPQVLRTTLESGGENLLRGLENLLTDLERGKGDLRISMTDEKAFRLGENIATTPGKVVFQNALMQLIHYTPRTANVRQVPLLIIPPWINKYYILDLREQNSFVRFCLDQGHSVFMISWANPDAALAGKRFDDYLREGPLAALTAIQKITGEPQANVIGYCLGGTLLACLLAWLAAHPAGTAPAHINSATFFVTLVDFTDPGDLGIFIDEEQLQQLEARMAERGYLEARAMAHTFNLLRANDLIWSFVVNNYLLGKDPFPFDLLYWNADSTNMPAAMHQFYLRAMYQQNRLIQAGGISLLDMPIDLRRITTPTYLLATRDDHIAPWKSTYAATQLYRGPRRFVLSGSGHIAGVINPPAAQKYHYWTNDALPADAETWLAGATMQAGSWWPDWDAWAKGFGGDPVPARIPGAVGPVIEDAPGSYVKKRAE